MSFGPNPWQQTSWDWRAAGNFILGGAGGGLLVLVALSGAQGAARVALTLAGLALVGVGLLCVWLEIGRPLRALNVFFNPRTSWMSREGFVAALLFPAGLASAAGLPGWQWAAAALALVFVYCQARILKAARGIPAWRQPLVVPMIVATALAEGAGLFHFTHVAHAAGRQWLLVVFATLLLARGFAWPAYRRALAAGASPRALKALDGAGENVMRLGTLLPLALIAPAGIGVVGGGLATLLVAAAGLLAWATGAWFKFVLVTRASFNQGFALKHLPVRGAAR